MRIETRRLLLRPASEQDVGALFSICSDPDVTRFLQWPAHKAEDETRKYVKQGISLTEHRLGAFFVIEREGTLIGTIGARFDQPHSACIGGFLGKECWRSGYGHEAGLAVVEWLRARPWMWRVHAQCDVENQAVAALLRKMGARFEGTLLRAWPAVAGGVPRDVFSWAWTRKE